jgi:lipid A 4'-phosphatase
MSLKSGIPPAFDNSSPIKPLVRKSIALFAFGLITTALAEIFNLDLGIESLFFFPGGINGGWIWGKSQPWGFLYRWGEIIPLCITAAIACLYALAHLGKAPPKYKKCCLAVILTVVLGPGLMVNGVLKEYWGRPRPADVVQFGGQSDYRPGACPGGPGAGKSFVCGHCAIGFSMASLVAFYPYHPALALVSLVLATLYGIALGVARMVQGGHFFTDVVWAGVIVNYYVILLYYLFTADWRCFLNRITSLAYRS